jgi:hypothetical protein
MSTKYTGGFITKSPVAPTTSAASGIWTLDQQQQAQKAGTWPQPPLFIEDVFSTYLYTGNGSTQTITNGINLAGSGGMVWMKTRSNATASNVYDTIRGNSRLITNATGGGLSFSPEGLTSFNSNGFTIVKDSFNDNNVLDRTYASWTFRKQPKFFDVVTWTGTGANRTISHSLGSVPACIWVKRTDDVGAWQVYHRSLANTEYLVLNDTAAKATGATRWNSTTPTSTVFSIGTDATVNASAGTYVAYIFANDAGGFGPTGSDNVISCGAYTGNGSFTAGPIINLGYEPQFVLVKNTSVVRNWFVLDTIRGLTTDGNMNFLLANTTAAEASAGSFLAPTSTGFELKTNSADMNANGNIYIYIAIRRGPMAVPSSGTSVFAVDRPSSSGTLTVDAGFPIDFSIVRGTGAFDSPYVGQRLTGTYALDTTNSSAEYDLGWSFASNTSATIAGTGDYSTWISWNFQRAPGFFDVVCYKGTGANLNITHNLTVVPEMIIVKDRSATADWRVYNAAGGSLNSLYLNGTPAYNSDPDVWNNTSPTSSVFTVGTNSNVNVSGNNYVAHLFATRAGVSKVGSYTGTGALQTVNCGFTSGVRFVMIKRTDSTGGWYVYDSTRGITSGNDPYVFMNNTAAEVTNTNYVDTDTTGFKVTAAAPAGLNASGGTYIFLAIA